VEGLGEPHTPAPTPMASVRRTLAGTHLGMRDEGAERWARRKYSLTCDFEEDSAFLNGQNRAPGGTSQPAWWCRFPVTLVAGGRPFHEPSYVPIGERSPSSALSNGCSEWV